MKYQVSENQFQKVISNYLDNSNLNRSETPVNIYYYYSKKDFNAQIRYNIPNKYCWISNDLINEISSFFSTTKSDVEKYIRHWFESKEGVEIVKVNPYIMTLGNPLKLSKNIQ